MDIDKFEFAPVVAGESLSVIPSTGMAWVLNRYMMERAVAAGEPLDKGLADILTDPWLAQAIIAGAQDLSVALSTRTEVTLNIPAVALARQGVFTLQQVTDAHASTYSVCDEIAPCHPARTGWWDGAESAMALMLAFIMEFDRARSTGDVASEDSAAAQPPVPPATPELVLPSYEQASLEDGARKYGIVAVQGIDIWPERIDNQYYLYDLRTGRVLDKQAFDTSLQALREFAVSPRPWVEDGRPVTGKELKR